MTKQSFEELLPKSFRTYYRSQADKIGIPVKTACGKFKRQFIRPSFPELNGEVNLHLGCASVNHPKFINIDGRPGPHIHYVRPLDNLSPFRNNCVDLIYASHCLEHFPHARVSQVLAEWFRVLKKGGILRLSVPDFDLLLNIYKENGNELSTIIGILMGAQNYKFNFHMTVFNRSSLENLLRATGFKQIQEWQPGCCEFTSFDDCSAWQLIINGKHYPVSLNIEAVK
jgi:predicted SAM-dependent methyltransferase